MGIIDMKSRVLDPHPQRRSAQLAEVHLLLSQVMAGYTAAPMDRNEYQRDQRSSTAYGLPAA